MTDTHQLEAFTNSSDLGHWYDNKYTDMTDGWDCPREVALSYLGFMGVTQANKEKRLLDVGCGAGHFIKTAEELVSCVGIDLSSVGIELAKKRCPGSEFKVADIEVQDKELGQFDYITSVGSVEHCISIQSALSNIKNMLKPNGLFFALVPNEQWQHFDQPHETTHTDLEWRRIFDEAGLKEVAASRNQDLSLFLLERA